MYQHRGMIALLLFLGVTGSTWAQSGWTVSQGTPSTFFGGVNPQDMTFKPIDTGNLVAPPPVPTTSSSSIFNLTRLFQNIKMPSFPPIFGSNQSPVPVYPGQHPDAFHPLLPTNTLPPPEHPDAFHPLSPFTPQQ